MYTRASLYHPASVDFQSEPFHIYDGCYNYVREYITHYPGLSQSHSMLHVGLEHTVGMPPKLHTST